MLFRSLFTPAEHIHKKTDTMVPSVSSLERGSTSGTNLSEEHLHFSVLVSLSLALARASGKEEHYAHAIKKRTQRRERERERERDEATSDRRYHDRGHHRG